VGGHGLASVVAPPKLILTTALLRARPNYMAHKQSPVAIFPAEWNFDNLAQELERTLWNLKETDDRNLQRKLLLQMRLLLTEADLLLEWLDQSHT